MIPIENKYIYLAAPYSLGDTGENVHRICVAADRLFDKGAIVFNPLLYHLQHMIKPRSEDDWCEITMKWLSRCDMLVYLPGESKGVDREIVHAYKIGIPVYRVEEVWG